MNEVTDPRRAWLAVIASVFGLVLGPSVILLLCFGIFMPALHAEFGWPLERIAFGASIISIVVMFLSPVQGALVDRFGTRRMVLTFVPVWGVSLLAMSLLPPSLPIFYLACAVLPLAALGVWPLSYLRVPTTWFDRRLGIALGVTSLGPGIGASLLPLILGLTFAAFGWRYAYVLLGLAVLALNWPLLALWLRDGSRVSADTASSVGGAKSHLGMHEVVRSRVFAIMVVQYFILGVASTGLIVNQVAMLVDVGVSQNMAIYTQSAVGIGSIAGRLITGYLLDRVRAPVIGALLFGVAAAASAILGTSAAAMLAVPLAAAIGFIIGAEFDLLAMLIRRYQGIGAFGRVFGWVFAAFQLGGSVGVSGLAFIRAHYGSYRPALTALTLALLLGGALFALMGRYRFGPESTGNLLPSTSSK